MRPAIKICGMKYNIAEVAGLGPDYLGFIFYDSSPRNYVGEIPDIPDHIKKVGVFVNSSLEFINKCIRNHHLQVIQLHGDESVEFCSSLRAAHANSSTQPIEIWKVFHILDSFDFKRLQPFERYVNAFLFDTKGTTRGGTGTAFDWNVLKDYNSKIPFVLSGGIGPGDLQKLKKAFSLGISVKAIDINSRFETEPGLKDIEKLKKFIDEIQC